MVTRQHDETELTEVLGHLCEDFVAVFSPDIECYEILYIKLSGVFHRFFVDAGLLFWASDAAPDENDDLSEGTDQYVNLAERYNLSGLRIDGLRFSDFRLGLKFSNDTQLAFEGRGMDSGAWLINTPH